MTPLPPTASKFITFSDVTLRVYSLCSTPGISGSVHATSAKGRHSNK
ncbi:MAG: hypothetical protein IIV52_03440 [Alistipes sp.]|nr:hypothetical protein [Alistipes sp.]